MMWHDAESVKDEICLIKVFLRPLQKSGSFSLLVQAKLPFISGEVIIALGLGLGL